MALTPIEYVRLRIGDTDPEDQLLSDQEIQELIDRYDSLVAAAAAACEALAARFAHELDGTLGPARVRPSSSAEAYRELAAKLWQEAAAGWPPSMPGIEEKADLGEEAIFSLGMHDSNSQGG